MAEPLFNEHPLQDYFNATESVCTTIPGGIAPIDVGAHDYDQRELEAFRVKLGWLHDCILKLREAIPLWRGGALPPTERQFAERFKYDVITSTLLSSAVTATPLSFHHSHSRRTSRTNSDLESEFASKQTVAAQSTAPQPNVLYISVVVVGFALLWHGWRIFATLAILVPLVLPTVTPMSVRKPAHQDETLKALKALRTMGACWDSVVNEAITVLETEERSAFYSLAPSSPTSSLRVAFQSTLMTTNHQCDNVRQLLAALTSPTELAQLSEMYAPASPSKPNFSFPGRVSHSRPLSLPVSNPQSAVSPRDDKRQTWSGSSPVSPGGDLSPTPVRIVRHKERRRSDINGLFDTRFKLSKTAPTTPVKRTGGLPEVREDEEETQPLTPLVVEDEDEEPTFGASALELRKQRRARGIEALAQRRSTPSLRTSLSSPASRLTALQTSRHPLSMSALHHALQGALASKRYACAHLLALRFEEDDDDGYWEDVRSVVALLTSTLDDARARLEEALDDNEKQRSTEAVPTPSPSPNSFSLSLPSPPHSRPSGMVVASLSPLSLHSFAPMPSDLSRFGAHLDAISSAMADAREHMKKCVASLEVDDEAVVLNSPLPPDVTGSTGSDPSQTSSLEGIDDESVPALAAYEQLRRELGLALRECERGRGALTRLLEARKRAQAPPDEDAIPILTHDSGNFSSTESEDKMSPATPPTVPSIALPSPPISQQAFDPFHTEDHANEVEVHPIDLDAVTNHLLLTSSPQHLPPQGIEQVFETEVPSIVAFTRDRPKLSREERIRSAKAKRESDGAKKIGLGFNGLVGGGEIPADVGRTSKTWGPGGDVVQELKDVIWKVGERRRKMSETSQQKQQPAPTDPVATGGLETVSEQTEGAGITS